MQRLLWTSLSLRNLRAELKSKGHNVSHTVVGDRLRSCTTVCRPTAKSAKEASTSTGMPNFNTSTRRPAFFADGEPVISVDTKKKELVGNFKNNGRNGVPKAALNWSTFMTSSIPS